MHYAKGALTIQQQLEQLSARGLHIEDEAYAKNVLLNVGYYRLSGYWWPLQDSSQLAQGVHRFASNATFKRAVELYQFDRKLRQLLSHALERIEVAIRALATRRFASETQVRSRCNLPIPTGYMYPFALLSKRYVKLPQTDPSRRGSTSYLKDTITR